MVKHASLETTDEKLPDSTPPREKFESRHTQTDITPCKSTEKQTTNKDEADLLRLQIYLLNKKIAHLTDQNEKIIAETTTFRKNCTIEDTFLVNMESRFRKDLIQMEYNLESRLNLITGIYIRECLKYSTAA